MHDVRREVRPTLPAPVNEFITGCLKTAPKLRPSAESLLGTTDDSGEYHESFFSRADLQLPVYWQGREGGRDEELVEVTDQHTMDALRRAVDPQSLPDDFGKGIDGGSECGPPALPPNT
eukprot:COSAG01_NODE_203_length_22128_cov_280.658359_12_plen_119_part_00